MGQLPQGRGIFSDLAFLLRQQGTEKSFLDGKRVHHLIYDSGYEKSRFLANWIVQMYGECGSMQDARNVFERILSPNTHSWTIVLGMYARNGFLEDAKNIFCRMPEKRVVSWNALMTAHVQNGSREEAIDAFYRLCCESIQADNVSFVCALDSCRSLEMGKRIHVSLKECGYMQDVVAGTALLTMYGRYKSVDDAKFVFNNIFDRDKSCWNAMMAALSQNGQGEEALDLFCQMQCLGVDTDIIAFVCVLDGCASFSTPIGQVIHTSIIDHGIEVDRILGTALVDMYGKCGNLQDAFCVFSKVPHSNVISWNAIISVFAQNGHGSKTLELFDLMKLQRIQPDSTTFIGILTACSHAGLVNLGWHFFVGMATHYGIMRTVDHYCCMIDLLGRAGHLDEAEYLLNRTPVEVDDVTWRSLLGACKIHGDLERGIRIANKCLALHTRDAAPYVTLLNIHTVSCNSAWQEMPEWEDT